MSVSRKPWSSKESESVWLFWQHIIKGDISIFRRYFFDYFYDTSQVLINKNIKMLLE